jgi:hypothetical protein
MTQVTWRAPESLVERVRRAATNQGRSLNEYLTVVLSAATDPELATSEAVRVRERLAAAGLLVPPTRAAARPDPEAVARARASAGRGTPLSEYVTDGR